MSLIEEWGAASPKSRAAHERAVGVLPDGVTHDVRRAVPFPMSVTRARGAHKWDADGRRLICYVMGHGSLLLGHSHPSVVRAISEQAERMMHPGASHPLEAEWAEEVVRLIPSAERVRFTSSGTEATLLALHVARGYTGRSRIVKLQGHFHGWHDWVAPGADPPFERLTVPGIPDELGSLLEVVPPEPEAVARALASGDVAALILEPAGALSGTVPLPEGLLADVRERTRASGTLLIFDEVVTGFRWGPGGVQGTSGVLPDLTTLGKVLGGGMPAGALAGPADVMAILEARTEPERRVHHTGTHNGNPLAAAAGTTTLRMVRDGVAQAAAAEKAGWLREQFNQVLRGRGARGFAYSASSHFCTLLGVDPPEDPQRELHRRVDPALLRAGMAPDLSAALHTGMQLRGVHLFHGHGFVSSAHEQADLDHTVEAFDETVGRMGKDGLL